MRNKLEKEVEDIHNNVFFAVRNGKAHAIKSYVENYFYKKGYKVECNFSRMSLVINLLNPKKNQSWQKTVSYVWCKEIEKNRSFDNSYSNFTFQIKEISVGEYFPRAPKMVNEFWNELKLFLETKEFEHEILELNYPFSIKSGAPFDSISLQNRKDSNLKTSMESGKINAKRNVVNLMENILLDKGYKVEAALKENEIVVEFTNTKRGQWSKCECIIEFETEVKEPTWNSNIDYTYRTLKSISMIEPKENKNKHYFNFLLFVNSEEFHKLVQDSISNLDYPFTNEYFLGF